MLRNFGYADAQGYFFFRDIDVDSPYGLRPDHWEANGSVTPVCAYDALLAEQQVMIFVR